MTKEMKSPVVTFQTPSCLAFLIQDAERAFVFTSGMAALATVTHLLSAGDHILAGDDLYGGTSRLLSSVAPRLGLEVTNVDTCDPECVACGGRGFVGA